MQVHGRSLRNSSFAMDWQEQSDGMQAMQQPCTLTQGRVGISANAQCKEAAGAGQVKPLQMPGQQGLAVVLQQLAWFSGSKMGLWFL